MENFSFQSKSKSSMEEFKPPVPEHKYQISDAKQKCCESKYKVQPEPKIQYETAMVHMNDCPTIRSDCVSSNRVVVNWNPHPQPQPLDSSYPNSRRQRQKSLPNSNFDDHQRFIQKAEKKKKHHQSIINNF